MSEPTPSIRRKSVTPSTTPATAALAFPGAKTPGELTIDPVPAADGSNAAWRILLSPTPAPKFQAIKMAARKRQNDIDKRSADMFAVHQKVTEAIRSRKTYGEIRTLIQQSNVVLNLPNERQIKIDEAVSGKEAVAKLLNVSYRQQGNLDMYSSDNVKLREKNRHDPAVKAATDRFWSLVPKTATGNVNKGTYIWYSRHLFFTFVRDATEQEFQNVVQEDWKNDAVYSCSMNERMFAFAVFNLADIWCETMEAAEYAEFISRCADVIAAAPAYTGSRREGDATDTADRAQGRRLSAQPVTPQRRRASGFEVFESDESDDEAPVEETLEQLEREMLNVENGAWYSTLQNICNFANEEIGDCEEDILRVFHNVQDRRYALFNDDNDASLQLEQQFVKEVELDSKRRAQIQVDIKERSNILKRVVQAKGDVGARSKKREREQAQHLKEQRNLVNDLRETTHQGFVRLREYRNSLTDLYRLAIKESLGRVDATQSDLRAFFSLQQNDVVRRCATDSERNDDFFMTMIDVSKDLEEIRKILQRRTTDPLEAVIYPLKSKDTDEMQLDSPKWVSACEWFEGLRVLRNETLEQVLFEVDEFATRAQFRGKQQLFAIHRQEIDFEGKLIDALAETNLLQNETKIERLSEAKRSQEAGIARRAKESEQFQLLVNGWKEASDAAQASHQKRFKAESAETKSWAKATTIESAFEASAVVLEIMCNDVADLEMEETVQPNQRISQELPMGATTPLQLLRFVLAQHDVWLVSFVEKLTILRAKIMEESHQFLVRIESAEEIRQFEHNTALLSMRLDDIHRIKKEMTEEETKQLLTVSCQVRLNYSSDVRETIDELGELLDSTRAAAERYNLLLDQRFVQRRAATNKIFAEQRYNILKFFEIEQLRMQTCEYRYTNQTASQRKAAKLAAQISDTRKRDEERIRLAKDKRLADEKEREERRLQKMQESEEQKRRAQEIKELKARDLAELRKKQMRDREQQVADRLAREKAERNQWREDFAREQNARNERFAHRKSVVASTMPTKLTPNPPTRETSPHFLSRRSGDKKAPNRATNKIQEAIDAEIAMFRNLNTESLAIDLSVFKTRRMEYFMEGASNRSIYQSECKRLNLDVKSSIEVLLSETPLEFHLASLQLSNFIDLSVKSLFDIIALNPIQKILLRGVQLDKDELKKLAQHLLDHPFIHVLDVSLNKDLGPHGGETLLALVKENKQISTVAASDSGIDDEILKQIEVACSQNQFARGFSRTDFDFIFDIFNRIDSDHNGKVDGAELKSYISATNPKRKSEVDGENIGKSLIEATRETRHDDIRASLLALHDRTKGKSSYSLEDVLCSVYPLSSQNARDIIKRYTDESNPVLDTKELEDFMKAFGENGVLTLSQLAKGLDEDPIALEAAFHEADIDDDGVLNLSEFVMFVSH
ncbi:Ca2+-binding protein, putative [Bodo saltans]|uniref:Ca2+-binding protein, putative n=1 Tax=Bodo saltans TaxID=75058 RepID=A0A0S4J624_BODSA|nr:Ca2+-binding protein, putative [Bodo saltans]|eukprot:CUG86896.1 Ca2+-binding protein, putative [Bodo saltans]